MEAITKRSRVTASRIAQEVGLAQSTVSHVLNGRGEELGIRPDTQRRVQEAAAKLGYLPNVSARAMRSGRFGSAALIQSARRVFVPPALLFGLTEALDARHMRLVVAESADTEIGETVYLPRVMRELSVDGLLVNVLQNVPPDLLTHISALHVPAVWINVNEPADCVFPDDFNGAITATKSLLELGHERIAFLQNSSRGTEAEHYSVGARRGGYEFQMRQAGLMPRFEFLGCGPIWEIGQLEDTRVDDVQEILKGPDRPTAIIAYENDTAIPVLLAALQLGLNVPRDLSLIMFHHDFNTAIGVSISTVIHNMRQVGERAVEMLEKKIHNPEVVLPPLAVPSIWFEGRTCAPVRKK